MLTEISSSVFREKKILFHSGLNVVMGDSVASNSIGKSTLMLIIDFAFGGKSYVDKCQDVVEQLGDHDIEFTFRFNDCDYRFRRSTISPGNVIRVGNDGGLYEAMTVDVFCSFLAVNYNVHDLSGTFRSLVNLYSRVWKKDNYNTSLPLAEFPKQIYQDSIDSIVKIFGSYSRIESAQKILNERRDEKKSLESAVKKNFVPGISVSEHNRNIVDIELKQLELDEFKNNLGVFAANISSILSRESLELKASKDKLIVARTDIETRLMRVNNNLQEAKYIKSRHLDGLVDFFPNVNKSRVAEIESFHSEISRIMSAELRMLKQGLEAQKERVEDELKIIDAQIGDIVKNNKLDSGVIFDRVISLTNDITKMKQENLFYEKRKEVKKLVSTLQAEAASIKEGVLSGISKSINSRLRILTNYIYGEDWQSPTLNFSRDSYSFDIPWDTGTGKAFASLLMFDIVVFSLTKLPILIHDSVLYKNLGNDVIKSIVLLYGFFDKQSFVALDEIEKFDYVGEILKSKAVIKLSNVEVLFVKDWRKKDK